jgi:hypothetical protein
VIVSRKSDQSFHSQARCCPDGLRAGTQRQNNRQPWKRLPLTDARFQVALVRLA